MQHGDQLQLQVSADTIRRRLHGAGIHHRIPAKKETLTNAHREGWLAFARQHVDKELDFWSRVVFTDEKTFRSSDHGRKHVWRMDNTRYCLMSSLQLFIINVIIIYILIYVLRVFFFVRPKATFLGR